MFCPKCKYKIRRGTHTCPHCGTVVHTNPASQPAKKKLLIVIGLLFCLLIAALIIAWMIDGKDPDDTPTEPTATQPTADSTPTQTQPTEPTTSDPEPTDPTETDPPVTDPPPTDPPATDPPPTDPPATDPPVDYNEMIGSLYTRGELEAMDKTGIGYGPGVTSDGKRPSNPENLQKKYEKYDVNFIAPDNGNMYLTFDCGYEYTATDADGNKYRVTERILDVLREKDVKAVFFITIHYAESQPDLMQRMIDEGHIVGNHTCYHPVMPDQTIDRMVSEIMKLHRYVKEHFNYEMNLFRFPTGEFSEQSLAVVQSLGYKSVHWSFAYADWDTENQPALDKALQKVTGSHHSGAIYLLHAISATNASILGDVIDNLRAEGYNLELFQ